MYISESDINTIRDNNNVVDIISKYIKLEKSGNIYLGLSPFKTELSPSFMVDEKKQMWHDFASGKSGDVIKFLTDYHKIPVDRAMSMLDTNGILKDMDQGIDNDAVVKQMMYDIYEEAAKFYQKTLGNNEWRQGREYLTERGMTDETIETWRLGMSPDCWGNKGSLCYHLRNLGFDKDTLIKTGLFKENSKGNLYDMYRNRVMFPIIDEKERVIGFGGRILTSADVKDKDQGPKYMNSPASVIFDKSNTLFGLNRQIKTKKKDIILCEGYMDVISLHQAGFTSAVASLGTALTSRQCEIIKTHADNVYLTYDADGPGIKAGVKAMYGLTREGLDVKVISTKPFKDPDEMIKKVGPDAFQKRIGGAKDVFSWFISTAEKGIKNIDVKKDNAKIMAQDTNKPHLRDFTTPEQVVDGMADGFDTSDPEKKNVFKNMIGAVCSYIHPVISGKEPVRDTGTVSKEEFVKTFKGVVKERRPEMERLEKKLEGKSAQKPTREQHSKEISGKDERI